jgi:hypothetical protein
MKKKQNEAEFEKYEERYRMLRAPLPTVQIHGGRSWGGSSVCSDDGQQRLRTPGTRAYELMWHVANEG